MSEYNINNLNNQGTNQYGSPQDGNIGGAITVGAIAAVVCAIIWAIISVVTGYQIGYMAIGAGVAVGYAIKLFSKFDSVTFGVIGALFAIAACVLGDYMSTIGFIAKEYEVSYFEAFFTCLSDFFSIIIEGADATTLLFYGIAAVAAFNLAKNSNIKD